MKTSDTERYRGFESHLLRIFYKISEKNELYILFGEVPKRPKGLAWKVSRSLIAAQGFKSLLLRFCNYRSDSCKFFLDICRECDIMYKLLEKKTEAKNKKVLDTD